MNTEIKVFADSKPLEIRTGDALPLKEPQKIMLNGDIKTVNGYLSKRPLLEVCTGPQCIDLAKSIIVVDKEKMYIRLEVNPTDFYGTIVNGSLSFAPEIELFKLNMEADLSREDVIKLFRFNKYHFDNPAKADEIIKAFQKFSAKAYVDLTAENDSRGNAKASIERKVETGIPESFVLNIPIYKGQPKEKIEVLICFDVIGSRTSFWFEAPGLPELLEQRKEEIFTRELECCENFATIYK